MLLPLRPGWTYGPVRSRRLGISLGINVLPPDVKVCSFNCVYCQYGWTDPGVLDSFAAVSYPPTEVILLSVAKGLLSLEEPPEHLTFSGHGEATLHPNLSELVDGVVHLRDRFAPSTRTAILSNSTRVGDPAVRAALSRLDDRFMKLDAGSQRCLLRFNQPARGIELEAIVAGLAELPGVTLQSLFAAGEAGNLGEADVADWLEKVALIKPLKVQVYTLDRAVPSEAVAPASHETLESIAALLRGRGIEAQVF